MKVGDIVVLKNDYNYTLPQSQVLTGPCEIIEIKDGFRHNLIHAPKDSMKYFKRYTIRTTYLIDGQQHITIVREIDITPISEIRDKKLKELGI